MRDNSTLRNKNISPKALFLQTHGRRLLHISWLRPWTYIAFLVFAKVSNHLPFHQLAEWSLMRTARSALVRQVITFRAAIALEGSQGCGVFFVARTRNEAGRGKFTTVQLVLSVRAVDPTIANVGNVSGKIPACESLHLTLDRTSAQIAANCWSHVWWTRALVGQVETIDHSIADLCKTNTDIFV